LVRFVRKQQAALIALAVYNFVFFFPLAFMGRVVSPNDVYSNFAPWAAVRPASSPHAQNSLVNDPPTAYYTLMSLVKDDWRAFHWNPYVACGIPGFGSSASAVLSPFILLPVLLVPLPWVYTVIIFLKLNAAFVFAYLWLREERLGRRGAAVGALVVAGCGIYAVRWLWQITNATALYPALLWLVRRTFNGRRTPVALIALIALAYALSGFPAAMAYGAYAVALYALLCAIRSRVRWSAAARLFAGASIALLIALPSLVPFAQLLRRSGYLEVRQTAALDVVFPPSHWRSFLDPERLGNQAYKNWTGERSLGVMNNYVESTVYLGLLTIPLALFALFNRRARMRWYWLAFAAFVFACMFGAPGIAPLMAKVPGFKYSALARVALLLPLPAGYLAAAGTPRRMRRAHAVAGAAIAALLAFDLALVAGRFHPYLPLDQARVPSTPMLDLLRRERPPFRIAPFFNYLWPNTSELVRLEDVRSHFGSEAAYRRLLQRLDPTAWGGNSTVLTLNSLKFNFSDPVAGLLGIRWYLEHKEIDIIKWMIFSATVPGVKETGALTMQPGTIVERTVRIEAEPFWAIELPVNVDATRGANPRLIVTLLKNGAPVWSRAFTAADANAISKVYIPLRPYARYPETVTLRVQSVGLTGTMLRAADGVYYGRVMTPVVFERELPDGRLFRNLAELPRFRAVSRLRKLSGDEFLAARDIDFAYESIVTDARYQPPSLAESRARVTLQHYAPDEQRVVVESPSAFFLASSEKLTPELAIAIDGKRVRPVQCDLLFAGTVVPAGRHEVVYSRRIARGWWWIAFAGAAALAAALAYDVISARRPG
jgi:hypothetical protein